MGYLLVLWQGAFHQSDGLTQRHTIALEDTIDIIVQRHKLLLVPFHTFQSVGIDLDGTIHTFGDLEVRLPLVFLIFKVFVFHSALRFESAKIEIIPLKSTKCIFFDPVFIIFP